MSLREISPMPLTRATLIVAAVFVPSVIAAQRSEGAARGGIDQTNRGFMSAFKAGDAAGAAALYAPNVIVVEPDGARYEGKTKVAALVKQYMSLFDFTSFDITVDSFGSSGDLAWAGGKEIATLADKKSKKSTSQTNTYLAVYERQADGKWLMRYLQETQLPKPSAK
jgi:uncharacterized protein (TIGR02246 family)